LPLPLTWEREKFKKISLKTLIDFSEGKCGGDEYYTLQIFQHHFFKKETRVEKIFYKPRRKNLRPGEEKMGF
jgi:hypothetical protein